MPGSINSVIQYSSNNNSNNSSNNINSNSSVESTSIEEIFIAMLLARSRQVIMTFNLLRRNYEPSTSEEHLYFSILPVMIQRDIIFLHSIMNYRILSEESVKKINDILVRLEQIVNANIVGGKPKIIKKKVKSTQKTKTTRKIVASKKK
jgi:hypothetical protein